jgi:hypothetical protein
MTLKPLKWFGMQDLYLMNILCNFFTKGGEIEELNEISQFEKKQFGGKL